MRGKCGLSIFLVPVFVVIFIIAGPQVWAGHEHGHKHSQKHGHNYCEEELDEAEVFIEYNYTDGDRGIQFFWDGEAWSHMQVRNESGRKVLDVSAKNNVRQQGLAEAFFESAEPTEDELPAEEFFERFPEGVYQFNGKALEKCWLVGEAELTHELPAPVAIDLEYFPDISWSPLSDGPEVVGYEVVVELEVIEGDDERVYVDTATLPGDVNAYTVSDSFLDVIEEALEEDILEELKVEIIASEESGNKTISEEEVEPEED